METVIYTFELPEGESILLPTFTSSASVVRPKPEPVWVSAKNAAAFLKEHGLAITTQTLYNREREGKLHTRRISARKIDFDLNEIKAMLQS